MRVLITGARGLVGKNTIEHNLAREHELLLPDKNELDLLDNNKTRKWINKNNPEFIIHCAGRVGGIQSNIKNQDKFLYENTIMGMNLINNAFESGVKYILNLGSSCMYPKNSENPITTSKILSGNLEPTNEGYALAKICIERYCNFLTDKNKDINYKTIIPCNVYGKYDNFDPESSHMIPGVMRRIHDAKVNNIDKVEIWGSGEARREFMYCEDLAEAIWFCMEKISTLPNTTNIGLGRDFSILEYYQLISEVINYKGEFYSNNNKPIGMKRKLVDPQEINRLGWNPRFSLRDGIVSTYNYFINYISKDE